jgi:hypothetical protein
VVPDPDGGRRRGGWPLKHLQQLVPVQLQLHVVVDDGEQRQQREGGHEERDEAVLEQLGRAGSGECACSE